MATSNMTLLGDIYYVDPAQFIQHVVANFDDVATRCCLLVPASAIGASIGLSTSIQQSRRGHWGALII